MYSKKDMKVLMCELVIMEMHTRILDVLVWSEVLQETHHFLDVFFSLQEKERERVSHIENERKTDSFSEKYKCTRRVRRRGRRRVRSVTSEKTCPSIVALFFR